MIFTSWHWAFSNRRHSNSGTLDIYNIVEQQSAGTACSGIFFINRLGSFFIDCRNCGNQSRAVDLPEAERNWWRLSYRVQLDQVLLFFNAEYINMITVSMLATTLFLGGWNGPGVAQFPPLGLSTSSQRFCSSCFCTFGCAERSAFPFDQLMNFGWKFLLPAAILNIVLTATVVFFTTG